MVEFALGASRAAKSALKHMFNEKEKESYLDGHDRYLALCLQLDAVLYKIV